MKTVVHFQDVVKTLRGIPSLRINDLRIYERESVAFFGLPHEHTEMILNQMTGAYIPDEGTVSILGTDSRDISDEKLWFQFVENFGIFSSQQEFQEGVSIGENIAMLYRLHNEPMEEPQLSASVLNLANLVQLTITDLSRMMSEATSSLRMKVRLGRAFAYHPKVIILCNPTEELNTEVSEQLVELIKRAKRKLRFTLVLFTSNVWLVEQSADRVIFLNPMHGLYVENQLRGWYHKLFPFLKPSSSQLLQLSCDALQHGNIMKATGDRIGNH